MRILIAEDEVEIARALKVLGSSSDYNIRSGSADSPFARSSGAAAV